MLKPTGSSGLSAPKAFRAENNEVVGGGSRADETVVDLLLVWTSLLGSRVFSISLRFNYQQSKANGAADTLSRFSPEKPGRSSSQDHSSLLPVVTNGLSTPKFV